MNHPPKLVGALVIQFAALLCTSWLLPERAVAQSGSACDLNVDGSVNVGDVQSCVNMVLGLTPCTANITQAGTCDVIVVQRVVNAAIGGPCVTNTSAQHTVSLSWTASVSSNVVGNNVYRASAAGGPFTKLNSSLVATTNYVDSTVQAGQIYYYVVTAVNNSSLESIFSSPASAVIPSP